VALLGGCPRPGPSPNDDDASDDDSQNDDDSALPETFECSDGRLIDIDQLCDGYFNCPDREDEQNCEDVLATVFVVNQTGPPNDGDSYTFYSLWAVSLGPGQVYGLCPGVGDDLLVPGESCVHRIPEDFSYLVNAEGENGDGAHGIARFETPLLVAGEQYDWFIGPDDVEKD